jgi:hypothetical protein
MLPGGVLEPRDVGALPAMDALVVRVGIVVPGRPLAAAGCGEERTGLPLCANRAVSPLRCPRRPSWTRGERTALPRPDERDADKAGAGWTDLTGSDSASGAASVELPSASQCRCNPWSMATRWARACDSPTPTRSSRWGSAYARAAPYRRSLYAQGRNDSGRTDTRSRDAIAEDCGDDL